MSFLLNLKSEALECVNSINVYDMERREKMMARWCVCVGGVHFGFIIDHRWGRFFPSLKLF